MAKPGNWSLYLDDERTPSTNREFKIARSVAEAKVLIEQFGFPNYISFDHDLGEDCETGFDFAKWIVEADLDGDLNISEDFEFNVHSANPVGVKNIEGLLNQFLSQRLEDKSNGAQ